MGNACTCSFCEKQNAYTLPGKEVLNGLDELICYIEKRLSNPIAADKAEESMSVVDATISDRVASLINYGSDLLENVLKRCKKHVFKIISDETRKVVVDVLKEASHIHLVAAGHSLVAYVLQSIDDVSMTNKKESVQILQNMYDLAKHIKRSNGHIAQQKLNDAVDFIVKGSFFCISRIKSSNLSRFFSSEVSVVEINSLKSELGEKYRDLKLQAVTKTFEGTPTELPSSQDKDPDEDGKQIAFDLPEDVLSGLDKLMSYIEKCLAKLTITDKAEESTPGGDVTASGRVAFSIKYGSNLLENVLTHCKKHTFKITRGETRKAVIDVLKETSQIHWVAAELSVVAFVLKNIGDASTNKQECAQFLQYMYGLVKQIKQLNGPIPQEKLHDVAEFIFKGSFFCVSRIQSSNLSRFFSSVVEVEEIKRLQSELGKKYRDLTLESVAQLFNLVPLVLPPSQREHPDAVGFDDAVSKVTDLLAIDDDVSTRAVVIYGIGGMGKTTLANAVSGSLDLRAYKYCHIIIKQDCSETDVKDLQERILKDLFGKRLDLPNYKRGQEEISKAFRKAASQPLFLFIDNALRGSDLAKLLPENLSCIPKRSRMLVTTRMLNETDMFDQRDIITRLAYGINFLPLAEAKQLLCKKALDSPDETFDPSLDIDGLLRLCGGIPLVLNLVGTRLNKYRNKLSVLYNTIEFFKDSLAEGESELTEKVVDIVYNSLQEDSYKDAFLDIAAFFSYWEQHIVSYIVGDDELVALEDAALIKISNGRVELHDVVSTRARKLSESSRITDPQSLADIIEDSQIWLHLLMM